MHPLAATSLGVPGFDDLVPDASEAGEQAWRAEVARILHDADALDASGLPRDDRLTLECLRSASMQELDVIDCAFPEHTVTAMPYGEPAAFLAVAARTVLVDPEAAERYVTRLTRSGAWMDQLCDRLKAGAAKGRLPVAPLVEQALAWVDALLSAPAPAPLLAAPAPPGWAGAASWEERRVKAAVEIVKPALARWADVLRDLLPMARDDEHPGLTYIPGGDADYARAVHVHTTLGTSAEELHRTGLEQIARLEERAVEIGQSVGLSSLEEVFGALRSSAGQRPPGDSIREALSAIRRAEAVSPEIFPRPLPPPCEVSAMPTVVASTGAAPHYTPPRLDGGRAGTFWFNTERPTAGTGWDLEVVAYHEAVPGHHLQLSRLQLLEGLPALQRQRSITVFSEGWALYSEQLAEEVGLYRDARGVLGAITASLMRAARLVVDTGLHAFGWSRRQAIEFYVDHVPMPAEFLAAEVNRYTVMPGQALSYMSGKLELLRLRAEAQRRLGASFSLSAFHGAVLDHGSLPMPVLRTSIDDWISGSR